jgi:pyridoxal phosphate enzyme (YggS family)
VLSQKNNSARALSPCGVQKSILKFILMQETIAKIQAELSSTQARLVAVTKTKPVEVLLEAYQAGLRVFGENKVQEMTEKYELLPKDIQWHFIGHLQTNKVKYIAPFVAMIQSVDSLKLLQEIDKQAKKNNRIIDCLLQVFIAEEETKFGFDKQELETLLAEEQVQQLANICIKGVMGMATNTEDKQKIRQEFRVLFNFFHYLKSKYVADNLQWQEISMGMSGDYQIAADEGSTLVRIGSAIFGNR